MADIVKLREALQLFVGSSLHRILVDFVDSNQQRYSAPTEDGEQSLDNYALFNEYAAVVEAQLSAFLEEKGLSSDEMWRVVKDLHESNEQDLRHEVSFLLASTDFERFCAFFEEYTSSSSLWGTGGEEFGGLEDGLGGSLDTGHDSGCFGEDGEVFGGVIEPHGYGLEGEGEAPAWA